MKLSKQIRLISIGVLILLALVFLVYPLVIKKSGVVVTSVSENSPCKEILVPGSVITRINNELIEDSDDFQDISQDLEGRVNLIVNDGPRVCTIGNNQTIGVKVRDFERGGIKFGVGIEGGKELVLETDETVKDLEIIKSRLRDVGSSDVKIEKVSDSRISIQFDPSDEEDITKVLEPGIVSFEFMKNIEIENGTGTFFLNEQTYDVTTENNSVNIEGTDYDVDDGFSLDGINARVYNVSENSTTLLFHVFDDRDVQSSNIEQNIQLSRIQNFYRYLLMVDIQQNARESFAKITKDQPTFVNPQGENYLQDPLVVMVDGEIITSFPVFSSNAGVEVEQLIVFGVEERREPAAEKLETLTTYLKSGRLTGIEIVEENRVEPENGYLLNLTIYITLGLICCLCVYGFLRKKSVEITGMILGVLATEVLLFLGVLSSQVFSVILLMICLGFTVFKGVIKSRMKWVSLLLIVVISFGAIANQLVVDRCTLFGFLFGFAVSGTYLVLVNKKLGKSRKKYEKLVENVWKVGLLLLLGLTVIFFIQDYQNFAISSVITFMISLSLTKPEYVRLVRKLKRR